MAIQPKRVAVIGGGCAGIVSFWALQKSAHDAHLFEASTSLRGLVKPLSFENGDDSVEMQSPLSFNAEASRSCGCVLSWLEANTMERNSREDGLLRFVL